MLNPEAVSLMLARMQRAAEDARLSAGANGHFNDGGAGSLQTQITAFQCGLENRVPLEWDNAYRLAEQEVARRKDPEYVKYLELKAKFEKR